MEAKLQRNSVMAPFANHNHNLNHISCQNQTSDELKRRIISMTLEIDALRSAKEVEIQQHEENAKRLLNLLVVTCQERDTARQEYENLQRRLLQNDLTGFHPGLSNLQMDSPAAKSFKGDSGLTECDSFSDTHDLHAFASSPAQSLLDTVSSIHNPQKIDFKDSSKCNLLQSPYIDISEECLQSFFPLQTMQPVLLPTNNLHAVNSLDDLDLQQNYAENCSISHPYYQLDELSDMGSDSILNGNPCFKEYSLPSPHGNLNPSSLEVNLQKHIIEEALNKQANVIEVGKVVEGEKTASQVFTKSNSEPLYSLPVRGSDSSASCLSDSNLKMKKHSKSRLRISNKCVQRDLSCNAVPLHLPEPPEADPQVIIKSLPERGKLLEAVMKAGPLLQTLLWEHSPSLSDSFELPFSPVSDSAIAPVE